MCKLVQYAKLLFDINAVILLRVHQVLLLYELAFAHHFVCTCIGIHSLSFKNVDTFCYSVVLNKILFRTC